MQAMQWLFVALGGALGALARAGVYEWSLQLKGGCPHYLPTLIVNAAGSLLIGVCWSLVAGSDGLPAHWRLMVMTGFLGALTTFSTFSLDLLRLLQSGQPIVALSYSVGTVLVCLLAAWIGFQGVRWLV